VEKNILNPSFKYTPSTKTDISKTFARVKRELNRPQNQDNNKPLVRPPKISLDKPLVEPILNPGGFVLSAEWFEMG
jgi:hypothetical protein